MTRSQLINHIKTLVNEISPTDGLPIPIDDFADDRPIDDMIDSLLNGAARTLLLTAPVALLPVTTTATSTATLGTDGEALMPKPSGYLRLLGIRLPGWQRRVVEAQTPPSNTAQRQSNLFVRAGNAKPVVVDLGAQLQLWPATDSPTSGILDYVAETLPENLSERLQQILCWHCASLYLQVTGDPVSAQKADERTNALF